MKSTVLPPGAGFSARVKQVTATTITDAKPADPSSWFEKLRKSPGHQQWLRTRQKTCRSTHRHAGETPLGQSQHRQPHSAQRLPTHFQLRPARPGCCCLHPRRQRPFATCLNCASISVRHPRRKRTGSAWRRIWRISGGRHYTLSSTSGSSGKIDTCESSSGTLATRKNGSRLASSRRRQRIPAAGARSCGSRRVGRRI